MQQMKRWLGVVASVGALASAPAWAIDRTAKLQILNEKVPALSPPAAVPPTANPANAGVQPSPAAAASPQKAAAAPKTVPPPAAAEPQTRALDIRGLQRFGDRLFVAVGGDAGKSAEVLALGPKSRTVADAVRTAIQGVSKLVVAKGALYALGTGLHRLDGDRFRPVALPAGIGPVRDVIAFRDRLVVVTGDLGGGKLLVSKDGGVSWTSTLALPAARRRVFMPVERDLFVSTSPAGVHAYTGDKVEPIGNRFFPGVENAADVFSPTVVRFRGDAVYLGGRPRAGAAFEPVGLFVARTERDVRGVLLGAHRARDLAIRGKTLYVLATSTKGPPVAAKRATVPPPWERHPDRPLPEAVAARRRPAAGVWTWVLSTKNLSIWEEVLAFRAPSPAVRFERLGGDFYFALENGRLVRLRAKDWKMSASAWSY